MTKRIRCRACKGSGEVAIPRAYRATLAALEQDWQTTALIHRRLGGDRAVKLTALANRLSWLKREGLATSRSTPGNFRAKEWRLL